VSDGHNSALRHLIDFVFRSRLGFQQGLLTSYMNFTMIGLLVREALDRLRVHLKCWTCVLFN